MEIIINFEKLVEYKIGVEAYFILYCLEYNKHKEILSYVKNCKKISLSVFEELEQKNYIIINRAMTVDDKITFEALKITKEGKQLFTVKNIDVMFDEFRLHYPRKTMDGRTLHLDLKRCKTLYKKIVGNDEQMHETLCKCAKAYHEEKKRSGSENYMQNLATWLYQENYKQYIDDVSIAMEGGHSEDI